MAEKKSRKSKRNRLERTIDHVAAFENRMVDFGLWSAKMKIPADVVAEMRNLVASTGKGLASLSNLVKSGWKPPIAAKSLVEGDRVAIAKEHSKLYGYIRSVAEGKAETMVVVSVVDAGRGSRLLIGSQDGKQSYGYIPQAHLVRS